MCNGSRVDGSLYLSLDEMQARCSVDAQCWLRIGLPGDSTFGPASAWGEGARFPSVPTWKLYEKACGTAPLLEPASEPAGSYVPPPWPAVIISSSIEKFCAAAASASRPRLPCSPRASVLPSGKRVVRWRHVSEAPCERNGNNGVRAAHRNAWRLIDATNTPMAVFKTHAVPLVDDVADVGAFLSTAQRGATTWRF